MFSFLTKKTIYRPSIYEIPSLDQAGLEIEWLHTKEELIKTNYDRWENQYTTICLRANEILPRLLAPYVKIFDPNQIKIGKYLKYSNSLEKSFFQDTESFKEEFGPQGYITISFYLFCGRVIYSNQQLLADRNLIREKLDALIETKEPLALLLKGIILKHGFTLPSPPNLEASRRYLTEAERLGSAEAKVELITLGRYNPLTEIKPANSINEIWT